MKITDLEIPDLKLIELKVFHDDRGFFVERFNKTRFAALGLPTEFSQDNHSRSHSRVLRGLHFQMDPPQSKIVGVIKGKIYDVAVDIRPQSKTFLKHVSVELSSENNRLLYVPGGFAHGFCVISEEPADVIYKVDSPYNPSLESGIRWNDEELGINWPIKTPLVSERDQRLMSVSEFKKGINR